jgi:hypothetical protein
MDEREQMIANAIAALEQQREAKRIDLGLIEAQLAYLLGLK